MEKDEELVMKVKVNDEESFEILVSRYRPLIFSIFNQFNKGVGDYLIDSDDILQEGCIALYQACRSYDESYNKENKSRKINEGYLYDNFGDFEVHKLSMDVLFPEGTVVSQNLLHRLYEAISDALEKEGCLMAGDYLEDEGGSNELSRVYHDNDF